MFQGLELTLRQTKSQVDEIEFRLDELGVAVGSA